jgi:hypothetical protein
MLILLTQALAAHPAWTLCPFGVGVYLHDRPVRGIVYSVTQVAGWSLMAWGGGMANQYDAEEQPAEHYRWEAVGAAGVVMGAGSWFVSGIDGGRLHELEMKERATRLRAWDQQLLAARGTGDD